MTELRLKRLSFTPVGVFIALLFIGLPFVVRTLQPVLEDVSKELEEESGFPVMALSAAANIGLEPVLDQLIEKLSPEAADAHTDTRDIEEDQPWSPL